MPRNNVSPRTLFRRHTVTVRSLVAAMAYPDMAALKAAFNGPARRGNEAENIPRICCRATAFAAAAR
jgi:hypothetical protein